MNILQVISSSGFFGAENVVLQLASKLQRKELCHPIIGVFENFHSRHLEMANECQKNGIDTVTFTCRGKIDIKTIIQLRRFIQERKIDIIHSHGYKSNLYSFFASRGLPVSLVATCHNWLGEMYKMRFYATLDRFFLRRFRQVVTVSDVITTKIIASGVSYNKVKKVQNGISLDRFSICNSVKKIKHDLGIADDATVIGTVGRISVEKGHRHFLSVTKQILDQYPASVFLIIGDGPLREELQREYDSPSIIFTGIRNDIPDLYQCMDIFTLPSLTEGLPMVLLEALASKLPVIATRVGDVPTVIKDKETGLLIEPGDEEAIRKSLLSLLANLEFAKALGQKGYDYVRENFSSERMATEYLNIYQELIEKR